jgi:CheY-like chemotaxis protein
MRTIKSILIVDDDDINNFINERLLHKLQIADEITVTNNGSDGIKCLQDHCFKSALSPELIFLDINMPVMDGFEFLKEFHKIEFRNKDQVTIAVLTTSSDVRDKEKMEQLGVKHYLNKPLTEEKILKFMSEIK